MIRVAERNRQIKRVLATEWPRAKVGTSYGWVYVDLDVSPETVAEAMAINDRVRQLIAESGIEIDTYTNDENETCACLIAQSRRDRITANAVRAAATNGDEPCVSDTPKTY